MSKAKQVKKVSKLESDWSQLQNKLDEKMEDLNVLAEENDKKDMVRRRTEHEVRVAEAKVEDLEEECNKLKSELCQQSDKNDEVKTTIEDLTTMIGHLEEELHRKEENIMEHIEAFDNEREDSENVILSHQEAIKNLTEKLSEKEKKVASLEASILGEKLATTNSESEIMFVISYRHEGRSCKYIYIYIYFNFLAFIISHSLQRRSSNS